MTKPKKPRATKGTLRTWAWAVGGMSFLAPLAAFGLQPKPANADEPDKIIIAQPAPKVIHKVRRIVIIDPPAPTSPTYVYSPSSGGSTSYAGGSSSSSSGGGGYNPPPVTSSGGS